MGGPNLYQFCLNRSVALVDARGELGAVALVAPELGKVALVAVVTWALSNPKVQAALAQTIVAVVAAAEGILSPPATVEPADEPITLPVPVPIPLSWPITATPDETWEDPDTCCRYRWIRPLGGDTIHNAYAASFQGHVELNLFVLAPSRNKAAFDAATPPPPALPPKRVYEAKTGADRIPPVLIGVRMSEELWRQMCVVRECKLDYRVVVDNEEGAGRIKMAFPLHPVAHALPGIAP